MQDCKTSALGLETAGRNLENQYEGLKTWREQVENEYKSSDVRLTKLE